jgi:predicted nucleic acid-binding protein
MNKKIFIDTDIVIDLLARREPYYKHASRLFTLADNKRIKLFVSSLTFANINYILSSQKPIVEVRKLLNRLMVLVRILAVDEKIIDLALNSDFKDFEDAIQYYCALENKLRIILTRNIKDYKKSKIPVLTAEEFLKSL